MVPTAAGSQPEERNTLLSRKTVRLIVTAAFVTVFLFVLSKDFALPRVTFEFAPDALAPVEAATIEAPPVEELAPVDATTSTQEVSSPSISLPPPSKTVGASRKPKKKLPHPSPPSLIVPTSPTAPNAKLSELLFYPLGRNGPNNQWRSIVLVLDFCDTYKLTCIDPYMTNHYSVDLDETDPTENTRTLPFSFLYDTGDVTTVPLTTNIVDPKLMIWGGGSDRSEKYMKAVKVRVVPIDLEVKSWEKANKFMNEQAPDMHRGDVVAISLGSPNDLLKFEKIRRRKNPYLPAKWLQTETLKQLQDMGLDVGTRGSSSNFIAFHLRLWDKCFKPGYAGDLSLDKCCCGHDTSKTSAEGSHFGSAFFEGYVKKKMREAGVERALILGHPIMLDIQKNTEWMQKKAQSIIVWPTQSMEAPMGDHPMTVAIMQQYMLTLAKETYFSTRRSTMTQPIIEWRKHYGLPAAKYVNFDFGH